MTEKEVMYRQEQNGQREFYLTLVDSKIYAYGYGAFALSRLTGHRVRRQQHTELGQLHMVWIPAVHLDSLRVKMFLAGIHLESVDEETWCFRLPMFDTNIYNNKN